MCAFQYCKSKNTMDWASETVQFTTIGYCIGCHNYHLPARPADRRDNLILIAFSFLSQRFQPSRSPAPSVFPSFRLSLSFCSFLVSVGRLRHTLGTPRAPIGLADLLFFVNSTLSLCARPSIRLPVLVCPPGLADLFFYFYFFSPWTTPASVVPEAPPKEHQHQSAPNSRTLFSLPLSLSVGVLFVLLPPASFCVGARFGRARVCKSLADPGQADPSQADPSRAEPNRTEPNRAQPSRAVLSHAHGARRNGAVPCNRPN